VSDAGSDAVSVLDVAAMKQLTRIPVGRIPKRIITAGREVYAIRLSFKI
jgi:YVTN family beta-propeller protein